MFPPRTQSSTQLSSFSSSSYSSKRDRTSRIHNSKNVNKKTNEFYCKDYELDFSLIAPSTRTRENIFVEQRKVIVSEVPALARPPLAFLVGTCVGALVAIVETKRRIGRLDARIYGGLDKKRASGAEDFFSSNKSSNSRDSAATAAALVWDSNFASSSSSEQRAEQTARGPRKPSSSSNVNNNSGNGGRILKASTIAALASVRPEMYLPTPKERSYQHTEEASTMSRESKVTFSRMTPIANATSVLSTLQQQQQQKVFLREDELDINAIGGGSSSSSTSTTTTKTRTLIACRWQPPETDPTAELFVGGNVIALGNWTPEKCAKMRNIGGDKWIVDVGLLDSSSLVEFKFVFDSEVLGRRAETGEVRKFQVPVLRGGNTKHTNVERRAPRWD
jgi:hypothetical protein